MKKVVAAVIRNSDGHILIVEGASGVTLPDASLEATQSPVKVLQKAVRGSTGLEINGIHTLGTITSGSYELEAFTAYVDGGKLKLSGYHSCGWLSPRLMHKLEMPATMRALIAKVVLY